MWEYNEGQIVVIKADNYEHGLEIGEKVILVKRFDDYIMFDHEEYPNSKYHYSAVTEDGHEVYIADDEIEGLWDE